MTATDLARRALAAVESGDDDAVAELIHPSHVDHAPVNGSTGPEGVRASLRWVRETFADRRVDIEDLIASGDRVVARVRFSANQAGELYGKPATGRLFEAEHLHIWRVADGRLAEHWMFRDDLGTMRQLGLLD
jgi:predicted ester cyclase